jgi:hypothetical protein
VGPADSPCSSPRWPRSRTRGASVISLSSRCTLRRREAWDQVGETSSLVQLTRSGTVTLDKLPGRVLGAGARSAGFWIPLLGGRDAPSRRGRTHGARALPRSSCPHRCLKPGSWRHLSWRPVPSRHWSTEAMSRTRCWCCSLCWRPTRRCGRFKSGRLRTLLLAGLWIGLAFQTKMLQAWLIVPALFITYLFVGRATPSPSPTTGRRRVRSSLSSCR